MHAFNPYSAFPRQSTYTPGVGWQQLQRAVNAPDIAGPVGSAHWSPQSVAGQYASTARTAVQNAEGGATARSVAALHNRPSVLQEIVSSLPNARHRYGIPIARPTDDGSTPQGGIGVAAPQPNEMGIPGRSRQGSVMQMAAAVIDSPIGQRIPAGKFAGAMLLTPQRNAPPWDD